MNDEKIIASVLKQCNLQEVKKILDEYDKSLQHLECDGFSRVVSYILDKSKIPHKAYFGEVRWKDKHFQHHYWIISESKVIDYRLRMWLGNDAPNAIFDIKEKFPLGPNIQNFVNEHLDVEYAGQPIKWTTNELIFNVLTRN